MARNNEDSSISQKDSRADSSLCSWPEQSTVGALFFFRFAHWKHRSECIVIGAIIGACIIGALFGRTWPALVLMVIVVYGSCYIDRRMEKQKTLTDPGSRSGRKDDQD